METIEKEKVKREIVDFVRDMNKVLFYIKGVEAERKIEKN